MGSDSKTNQGKAHPAVAEPEPPPSGGLSQAEAAAGHLTIFATRTRGPFWSSRPARVLLMAVFGTQLLATLIAVYGVLMFPIGWRWGLFVWGYALAWFFFNDRVKLLGYRVFDHGWGALLARRTKLFPA